MLIIGNTVSSKNGKLIGAINYQKYGLVKHIAPVANINNNKMAPAEELPTSNMA